MATPGALDAFEASGESPLAFLERHLAGDWGELSPEDIRENELSLQHGWRLLSAYRLSTGVKVWVITEADPRRDDRHNPVSGQFFHESVQKVRLR